MPRVLGARQRLAMGGTRQLSSSSVRVANMAAANVLRPTGNYIAVGDDAPSSSVDLTFQMPVSMNFSSHPWFSLAASALLSYQLIKIFAKKT